ncbi:MAG: hypothetical protein JNG86_16595 [Verrucomicrobiaceae bacterium]|nr:hypothetical protein [Verrucomicrobiaceae bacterium]
MSPSPGILATIASVFRANRVPCVLLNVLVVALVVSYYHVPAVAGLWESVGDFKLRWSYAFSLASTIFAAAVMPFGVQALMGTLRQDGKWRRLALLMLFWGYRGMEIDLFYRAQGWLFGHDHDARTLVIKVVVDQFVMSPLWFVPTYVIALRWIERGGSWSALRATLDRLFWFRTLPMVLVTNWIVWIPALALVYSLPPALQFPLFSIVMCFFILVVTVMARSQGKGGA